MRFGHRSVLDPDLRVELERMRGLESRPARTPEHEQAVEVVAKHVAARFHDQQVERSALGHAVVPTDPAAWRDAADEGYRLALLILGVGDDRMEMSI